LAKVKLSSRDVFDGSPFLKVRVETIELPDGRFIPDYFQLEMPSFSCIFAETSDDRIIVYRQYRHHPIPSAHIRTRADAPHQCSLLVPLSFLLGSPEAVA
jgi:ADP-ribose pyrophosphatase